jgi:transposase
VIRFAPQPQRTACPVTKKAIFENLESDQSVARLVNPNFGLIGVAPYDDDSGKRRGERHIKGGRRWVRNAIYMPCVGAATLNNPVLKAYYRRLIAKGKEPKVAIIACMRKLIVILNTMIARRQKWDPSRYAMN